MVADNRLAAALRPARSRADVVAGLTVAALVIPKNLGYAGIAHLPVEFGLLRSRRRRAALRGVRHVPSDRDGAELRRSPRSRLGAVLATGVSAGEQTNELVAAITIASAVLFFAIGVLRMGWISQFLSRAVVTGFLFGAAIQVVVGELGKLTGSPSDGDNTFAESKSWLDGTRSAPHRDGSRLLDRDRRRRDPATVRPQGAQRPRPARGRTALLDAPGSRGPRGAPSATFRADCHRSSCPTEPSSATISARSWRPRPRSC